MSHLTGQIITVMLQLGNNVSLQFLADFDLRRETFKELEKEHETPRRLRVEILQDNLQTDHLVSKIDNDRRSRGPKS